MIGQTDSVVVGAIVVGTFPLNLIFFSSDQLNNESLKGFWVHLQSVCTSQSLLVVLLTQFCKTLVDGVALVGTHIFSDMFNLTPTVF